MTLEIDKVSVLMPVHNGAEHLQVAVNSVLCQSYSNFELIIVDDGSTDDSWKILSSISDSRVLATKNETNFGLSRTLNIASRLATGDFLARHDQDDISHSDRLRRQVEFLNANPHVVAVGTWVQLRRYTGKSYRDSTPQYQHPISDSNIRLLLTWDTPFVHGSIMMRRAAFEACGGYSEDVTLTPPEDYELWTRMCAFGNLANIPAPLVTYQVNPNGMSQTRAEEIFKKSMIISRRVINSHTQRVSQSSLETSLAILRGRPGKNLRLRDFVRADHLIFSLAKAVSEEQRPFPLKQALRAIRIVHFVQLGRYVRNTTWMLSIQRRLFGKR